MYDVQPDWPLQMMRTTERSIYTIERIEKPKVPGKDREQVLITEHQQKGQVLFQWRFFGYQAAKRIGARMFPVPPSHCCCSNLTSVEATFKDMYLGVESSIKQHIISPIFCSGLALKNGKKESIDTFSATLDLFKPWIESRYDLDLTPRSMKR
jgi:hypothetical protein